MFKFQSLLLVAAACVLRFSPISAEDQSYIYLPGRQLDQNLDHDSYFPTWLYFDESDFLSLCDHNDDKCLTFNHCLDDNNSGFKVYNPDSNWDSYLSTTRCGGGDLATTVESRNNRTYKYCDNADIPQYYKSKGYIQIRRKATQ